MRTNAENIRTAIANHNLDSLKAFYATGLDDNGDDTAHWANQICEKLNSPESYPAVYQALTEHHDNLLAGRLNLKTNSRFTPDACPTFHARGEGPEHSCASPTTCTAAPDWWEDHCHIYPTVAEYSLINRTINDDPELAAYTAARARLTQEGTGAWIGARNNDPLTLTQKRDLADTLNVTTRQISTWEKRRATLAQRRSELYATLGPYYARLEKEGVRRFRGAATGEEDIRAFAAQALYACIGTYNPDRKIPIQAYIRKNLPGRIIDRLRMEGIFTRSEGALANALAEIHPEWMPNDTVSAETMIDLAKRLHATVDQVGATLVSYTRKIQQIHLDHTFEGDGGEPGIQVRAGKEYEVEHQIDAMEDRREANRILSHILEGAAPKTLDAVATWFNSMEDHTDPRVREFVKENNMTVPSLRNLVAGVVEDAQSRMTRNTRKAIKGWETVEDIAAALADAKLRPAEYNN